MIVFPQALILTAAATPTPLTHSRIGYQTYIRARSDVDVTASSTASGSAKDAPLRPDTFEYWEPTALPATWQVDLGQAVDIDYSGLYGRIGSAGCAVKCETSTNAIDWEILGEEIAQGDDAPIMFLDDARVARYIRFTFTGGGTMPRLAVAYAGEALAMQRSIYGGHTPLPLSRDTVLDQALSQGGEFLGQGFRRHGISTSASFSHLTASWYRENFDPFVKAARQYPYFMAWRPSTFPREVGYVWTGEDIKPVNMGKRDFMSVSWAMRGVGWE